MSNADFFLKKTLGEDFMESLQKFELWKPGTKSTTDHEEIRTALQIVPRTVMAMLIRELAPMEIGDNKKISLHIQSAPDAEIEVTKHERDVYSGQVNGGGKKLTEFKFRSIPGVGLVIMSTFELYDMDNLINSSAEPSSPSSEGHVELKLQQMIDERLALHELIARVVEKKILERDAINQLVMARLSGAIKMVNDKVSQVEKELTEASAKVEKADAKANVAVASLVKKEKKSRPVQEFLEKRKTKEFSLQMTKGEKIGCPDCKKNIFDGTVFSGCICLGDDMDRKVYIKKSEGEIKVRFGRGWDPENIEMLLDVLQKK